MAKIKKRPVRIFWTKVHGKLWLNFTHQCNLYEIPFDPKSRCIDGMVLFGKEKHPPLIKSMMSWECEMPEMLKNPDLLPVNQEIERFQAPEILKQGGTLEFTKPEEAWADEPPISFVGNDDIPMLIKQGP